MDFETSIILGSLATVHLHVLKEKAQTLLNGFVQHTPCSNEDDDIYHDQRIRLMR